MIFSELTFRTDVQKKANADRTKEFRQPFNKPEAIKVASGLCCLPTVALWARAVRIVYSSSSSKLSRARNTNEMHQMPAKPTTA